MQPIPLHLIESFVMFGEHQNFVKTAKELSQTQPSTSRQLEQFQKYFKRSLFKTIGRQKKLTDYGQQIQLYYKKSILELRELQKNIDQMSFQNKQERLVLAARQEILRSHISPLKFQNPVHFKSMGGEKIREAMESSQLDIAVLQENFESYNYFRKKLFSTAWALVIPKNWNATPANAQQWFSSVGELPFATYDKSLQTIYPNALKKIPLNDFNLKFISDDWHLISEKIQQQACWSILPQQYAPIDKVIILSLNDYFKESYFYLYFRKDLSKNKDVQNLIAQLS